MDAHAADDASPRLDEEAAPVSGLGYATLSSAPHDMRVWRTSSDSAST